MSKPESVTAGGTGSVHAAPDVLRVDLAIEAHDVSVDGALDRANRSMSALQAAMLGAGVAAGDLRTSSLGIRTEYDRQGRTVSGYVVTHGLDVLVRDLSSAGDLISQAAVAGGDSTRINGLTFDIEDDSALLEQARQDAVEDSRRRAQAYARAAGRQVGRALRIREGAPNGPVPVRARMLAAAEASPVPLQEGSREVTVTVTVEWALE